MTPAPVRLRFTIANVHSQLLLPRHAATLLPTARTTIAAQRSPPLPLAATAIAAAIPASWASPVIRAAGHTWGIRISRAHAVAAAAVEAAWVAAPAVRQALRAMAALAVAVAAAAAGAMSVGTGSAMHRGKLQWVLLLAGHKHNNNNHPRIGLCFSRIAEGAAGNW